MRHIRKTIAMILITSLIVTLCGSPTWAAAVDREAPELTSISLLSTEIESGAEDKLRVQFGIVEEGIGVLTYEIYVKNLESGQRYILRGLCEQMSTGESIHYCFTGVHTAEFSLSTLPAGEYQLTDVVLRDDAGNGNDIFEQSKLFNTGDRFTIKKGTESNLQALQDIEIASKEVSASGTLLLDMTLGSRASHNISTMNIQFREKSISGYHTVKLETPYFPGKSGTFRIELPMKNGDFRNADYYIESVKIHYDRGYGSSVTYSAQELGLTGQDSFTVTGGAITPDYVSPQISSVSFLGSEVAIPGAWNADIDLQEEGNGAKLIILSLRNMETGEGISSVNRIGDAHAAPVKTGTYRCSFPFSRAQKPGNYRIESMTIRDQDGNYTQYDQYSGIFSGETMVTITSPYEVNLKFFVSLMHSTMMDQVNGLQPGETGIIDISGEKNAPAALFRAIAGKDVNLIFDFLGNYQWIINGLDVDPANCKDIDLEVHYNLFNGAQEGFANEEKVLILNFRENGILPGKMTFRAQADYLYANKGFNTDGVKLYYQQGDKTAVEKTDVVKAADGTMEFDLTHNSSFAVSASKPSLGKVQKLTAKAVNTKQIKIEWQKNKAATGYYVYRSTSKNGTYKKIATVKTSSYTDKNLTAGKKYYYKVKAYNSKRSSINKTAKMSSCVSENPRLAAPKVLTTSSRSGNPDFIYVTWKATSGASKYYVYRSTSKNGTYKKIATTSRTYYSDKTAKPVKKYYYKIKAIHPKYSKYNSLLGDAKSGQLSRYKNGVITKI